MFDESKPEWASRREHLQGLLNDEDYAQARASVLNAHYTHAQYVEAIWHSLAAHGLTSGHVLEPGCGAGTFIGLAPDSVAMTGVELDPTTSRIARALYPDAEIRNEGYEKTPTTRLFDAAVGNVPFGDYALYDPANNPGEHSIHNHFIIKALAQTKPGGYVAVLTSHHTLDAKNPSARRDMYERADLISAIRLPSGAHEQTADTQVVTDLLVFRVRKDGEEPRAFTWEHARSHVLAPEATPIAINDAIMSRPDRVIGTMSAMRGLYGAVGLHVASTTDASAIAAQITRRLDRAKHRTHITIDKKTGEQEEDIITTRPPVFRIFAKDPYAALTRAIEVYDDEAETGRPAPLLERRQVFASYIPKGASTPEDALAICLDQKGVVDLDYCQYLLAATDTREARATLGELVFDTPEGDIVRREEYLSGNVRAKLAAAKELALTDPAFQANVDALQSVMPDDLGIADICVTLGAPWIPVKDHQAFLSRELNLPGRLTYNPSEG